MILKTTIVVCEIKKLLCNECIFLMVLVSLVQCSLDKNVYVCTTPLVTGEPMSCTLPRSDRWIAWSWEAPAWWGSDGSYRAWTVVSYCAGGNRRVAEFQKSAGCRPQKEFTSLAWWGRKPCQVGHCSFKSKMPYHELQHSAQSSFLSHWPLQCKTSSGNEVKRSSSINAALRTETLGHQLRGPRLSQGMKSAHPPPCINSARALESMTASQETILKINRKPYWRVTGKEMLRWSCSGRTSWQIHLIAQCTAPSATTVPKRMPRGCTSMMSPRKSSTTPLTWEGKIISWRLCEKNRYRSWIPPMTACEKTINSSQAVSRHWWRFRTSERILDTIDRLKSSNVSCCPAFSLQSQLW